MMYPTPTTVHGEDGCTTYLQLIYSFTVLGEVSSGLGCSVWAAVEASRGRVFV